MGLSSAEPNPAHAKDIAFRGYFSAALDRRGFRWGLPCRMHIHYVAVEHVYIKPFCGPCADICARASARVADGCSWFSWTPHSLSPFLFHFLPMGIVIYSN